MHPALTALGGNFLARSESKKGKAAQENQIKSNFETACGRGVYTSGCWSKAVGYSAPLLYSDQNHLIKFLLLVEVPGDLSEHGVGITHRARAVCQTTKKRKAEFHMDKIRDSWLIIQKSDYINALAADAGEWWHPGAGEHFQAWARHAHCQSVAPKAIGDGIYDLPFGLNHAIRTGDYKLPLVLQQRRDRHAMETKAQQGHAGEEACTIMTMDGLECMSSGFHILGVFVGYMGWTAHKRTTNEKRKDYAGFDVSMDLLPCFMKAK